MKTLLFSCLLAGIFAASTATQAQVLQSETFTGTQLPNWKVGGSARLTAPNQDPAGQGYLELTTATQYKSGYAINKNAFASQQGLNISFDFFSYGSTNPADGFSVFLLDGTTNLDKYSSPAGANLGYVGVDGGYLCVGLDEYGNYMAGPVTNEPGVKNGLGPSPNRYPQRVGIRGSKAANNPLLAASDRLPFDISVATARAQLGSADYRHLIVNIVPVGASYRATVRVQNGSNNTTAISSFELPAPPSTLFLGLAGSTGESVNYHEIRNLTIVVPPVATDDFATTPNNTAVRFSILTNDRASGSSIDPATVDLDPTTTQLEKTMRLASGTFTVDDAGLVTFTPASEAVIGDVRLSYVVTSRPTYTSSGALITPATATNIANIVASVGGQNDVATTLTGPELVRPGATFRYTVTVSNLTSAVIDQLRPQLSVNSVLQLDASNEPLGEWSNGQLQLLPTGKSLRLAGGESRSYTIAFIAPDASVKRVEAVASNTSLVSPDPDGNPGNNNGTSTAARVATDVSATAMPLPVELTAFTATTARTHQLLQWSTATETNSQYFAIERRTGTTAFATIGRVNAQGTSTQKHAYSFQDSQLAHETTYYRLRQVDRDSSSTYSPVVSLQPAVVAAGPEIQLYPNPIAAGSMLTLLCPATARTIQIMDHLGKCVLREQLVAGATNSHPVMMKTGGLAAGFYFVQLQDAAMQQTWRTRFVVHP